MPRVAGESERRGDELFFAALSLESADREAFLEKACSGDEALRADVESLLLAHDEAPRYLDEKLPKRGDSHGPVPGDEDIGRFGRFALLHELGRGGQGSVYLARDPQLGRRVALKVLSISVATAPDALERFRREAEAASRLDHPGICTIYEAGECQGVPYMAMRYVEGETLSERIQAARGSLHAPDASADVIPTSGTHGPATSAPAQDASDSTAARDPLRRVLLFFERTARALHVAHEAGLIHRDIKPGNLMVSRGGEPVILDFGLVRSLAGDEPTLTRTGDVLGTPHYLSPEQLATETALVDRTTDVYSLGATFYESLTLHRPFEAATREGLYQRILSSHPTDPRQHNAALSRDLVVVLETALEKDPARRYQSALDFAEDLRRVREYEPIRARPAGTMLRLRRWTQRNPALASATAAAFLLLLTALGISLGFTATLTQSLRHTRAIGLAAESATVAEENPLLGLLLARAAFRIEDNLETLSQLHAAFGVVREKRAFVHDVPLKNYLDVSPAGGRFLTACEDGTAHIWSFDGLYHKVLRASEHGDWLRARYSPSGAHIVTAAQDGTVRIWSGEGEPIKVLEQHEAGIHDAVYTPDGRFVITGSDDGFVSVWNVESLGAQDSIPVFSEKAHTGAITTVAVHPDGDYVLTASRDSTARLWTFREGTLADPRPLDGDGGQFVWAEFSPDREHFLTVLGGDTQFPLSQEYKTTIWNLDGERRAEIPEHLVNRARFSPEDGESVVTCTGQRTIRRWDLDGNPLLEFPDPGFAAYYNVSFSPDGERILASAFGPATVIDTRGAVVARLGGHEAAILYSTFTPDGAILTSSLDHTARLWVLDWGDEYPIIQTGGFVADATFTLDGERIISCGQGVHVWDLRGRKLHTPVTREINSYAVVPCSDGKILIANQVTSAGELRSMDDDVVHARFPSEHSLRAQFSPKEDLVVTAMPLRLWDRDGTLRCEVLATTFSVDFSPDGEYLAAGHDQEALLYDLELKKIQDYPHDSRVWFVDFHPDGHLLLTASTDPDVRLWSRDGEELRRFVGHDAQVWSCRFSPDGNRVVTASADRTARVWDLQGNCQAVLRGHDGAVLSARFSPDGQRIVTTSSDGTVRVWPVDRDELLRLVQARLYRDLTRGERRAYRRFLED